MDKLPVIELITKSIEGGFDAQELQDIESQLRNLEGDDLKKAVLEIKQIQITQPAKQKLLDILNEISNPDFGFDGLKVANTSDFFGLVLNKSRNNTVENGLVETRFKMLDNGLTELSKKSLGKNIDVFSKSEKTLNIVIWNLLVEQIGLKSGAAYMAEALKNKVMGPINSVTSAINGKEVVESADEDLGDMGKIASIFQNFNSAVDAKDEEKAQDLGEKLNKFLEFIVRDEYKSLNDFCNLAKEKNIHNTPDFQKLLQDPVLLSQVMKTGVYNKGNVKIDIKNKIIEGVVNNQELQADKTSFMKEVIKNTNSTGEKMDDMRDKFSKMAKMFDKMGLSSDDLRSMKEDLSKIPVIGELLAVLLGFFMRDDVTSELDKIGLERKYKKVVTTFFEVSKTDKNTSFTAPEKQDKKDLKKQGESIAKFLENIGGLEKKYNIDKKEENQIHNSFENKDLWKILLGKEPTENTVLQMVQKQVQAINTESGNITQAEFITELSILQLIIPETQISPDSKNPQKIVEATGNTLIAGGAIKGGLDKSSPNNMQSGKDNGEEILNKSLNTSGDMGRITDSIANKSEMKLGINEDETSIGDEKKINLVNGQEGAVDVQKKKVKIPVTPKVEKALVLSVVDTIKNAHEFPIILPDGRNINYNQSNYAINIGSEIFSITKATKKIGKFEFKESGSKLRDILKKENPNFTFTNNNPIISLSGENTKLEVKEFKQLLKNLEENKSAVLTLGDNTFTFSQV